MKTSRDIKERLSALEQRRLEAAELFAHGVRQADVARRLGVTTAAVAKWHTLWLDGGADALKSPGRTGPKPKTTKEQRDQIAERLVAGPGACGYKTELWTLDRIADLMENVTGVRYHPGHVWKVLHSMGFSCQKPQKRAKERDEAAIAVWVSEAWPRTKRGQRTGRFPDLCR